MSRRAISLVLLGLSASVSRAAPALPYKSPTALVVSADGSWAYVANHTADSVSVIHAGSGRVEAEIPVGRGPKGLVLSPDGTRLYVALSRAHAVGVVDLGQRRLLETKACGYEPWDLALSRDGRTLYTSTFISNDISVIALQGPATRSGRRIPVPRTPTELELSPDGNTLWVNHLLAEQPATDPGQTTFVSQVDLRSGTLVRQHRSSGNMLLNIGLALAREAGYVCSVHARPNFNVTPTQLQQGWVHNNALTLVPIDSQGEPVTVLLDNVSSGAANPHGVVLSRDGKTLLVGHRGTHEISVIDLDKLRSLLDRSTPQTLASAPNNLGFLWTSGDIIRRVPCGGLGPNGMAVCPQTGQIYVANYFSDTVTVLDPQAFEVTRTIDLGGPQPMDTVRRGEFLFNDGTKCFQRWLSCTSCHPDTRADSVNWDLVNDGMRNPKNAKSMILSWATPPAMSLGVRASMEVAVEKGFFFVQFVTVPPSDLDAVRAYLRAAEPIPSPWHRLADGSL
ncbi:MAG: beta-propeller fold lactonase family protein, partial [Planctomycetes bacterium]|nr:beta-propeller fold lactonase family protein [Planctomycetota bacterium]